MKNYEKPNIKARRLMLLTSLTVAFIFSIVLFILWIILRNSSQPTIANGCQILAGVLWIVGIISSFVRYERFRYSFSDDEIVVRRGFLFLREDIVPMERLQKIATESGPYDRIFGLAKVEVTTAGGDVTIPFLEAEKAADIVESLKQKINDFAVQSRNAEAEKRAELEQEYLKKAEEEHDR